MELSITTEGGYDNNDIKSVIETDHMAGSNNLGDNSEHIETKVHHARYRVIGERTTEQAERSPREWRDDLEREEETSNGEQGIPSDGTTKQRSGINPLHVWERKTAFSNATKTESRKLAAKERTTYI